MAWRYFGLLPKAEATALFEAWAAALPARSEWFTEQWARVDAAACGPDMHRLEDAMRFAASQVRRVHETPAGQDLPGWLLPGSTYHIETVVG